MPDANLLLDDVIRQASNIVSAAAQLIPALQVWQAPPESPQALVKLQVESTEVLKKTVKDATQRRLIQTALQVMACAYRKQWGMASDQEQVMVIAAWRAVDNDLANRLVDTYIDLRNRGEEHEIRKLFGG